MRSSWWRSCRLSRAFFAGRFTRATKRARAQKSRCACRRECVLIAPTESKPQRAWPFPLGAVFWALVDDEPIRWVASRCLVRRARRCSARARSRQSRRHPVQARPSDGRSPVAYRPPFVARIAALADCYDALRSARRYRPAVEESAVVDWVLRESARAFDPDVVDAVLLRLRGDEDVRLETIWLYEGVVEAAAVGRQPARETRIRHSCSTH